MTALVLFLVSHILFATSVHIIYKTGMLNRYRSDTEFGFKEVIKTKPITYLILGAVFGGLLFSLVLIILLKEKLDSFN